MTELTQRLRSLDLRRREREETGHSAAVAQALEPMRAHFITESGANGPLAQVVAFYLAGAQRDLGNYADASSLAEHLDAAQLSAAEPRDDWNAQLEALRRSILQGLHARR